MILEMFGGLVTGLAVVIACWTLYGRHEDTEEFMRTLNRETDMRDKKIRDLSTEVEVLRKADNAIIASLKERNETLEKRVKDNMALRMTQRQEEERKTQGVHTVNPIVVELEPFGKGTQALEKPQVIMNEKGLSKREKKMLRR
jgi:hypothetical protein